VSIASSALTVRRAEVHAHPDTPSFTTSRKELPSSAITGLQQAK
jgi:hypothetical protein